MSIPTSNKPGSAGVKAKPAATRAPATVDPEKLSDKKEAELTKIISQVKGKAEVLKDKQSKLEGNKVELMYDIGAKLSKLVAGLTPTQTASVKRRFAEATAIGTAFANNCVRFTSLYTRDDLKEILTAGLNTKMVWVLVTIEHDSDRKKLLKLALTGKYGPDDLRAEVSKMKLKRVEASGDPTKITKVRKKNFDMAIAKGITAVSGLPDIFEDISGLTDTFDPETNKDIVEKAIEKLNVAEDTITKFRNQLEELIGGG